MNRNVFAQLGILAAAAVAQHQFVAWAADGGPPAITNTVKLTPAFLNALVASATRVTLADGGKATVQLTMRAR